MCCSTELDCCYISVCAEWHAASNLQALQKVRSDSCALAGSACDVRLREDTAKYMRCGVHSPAGVVAH